MLQLQCKSRDKRLSNEPCDALAYATMKVFWSFVVASLTSISSVKATAVSTGFTVSRAGIDYLIPPKPVANINVSVEVKALFKDQLFATLTNVQRQGNGILDLTSITIHYAKQDDVWQEGFLESKCFPFP